MKTLTLSAGNYIRLGIFPVRLKSDLTIEVTNENMVFVQKENSRIFELKVKQNVNFIGEEK